MTILSSQSSTRLTIAEATHEAILRTKLVDTKTVCHDDRHVLAGNVVVIQAAAVSAESDLSGVAPVIGKTGFGAPLRPGGCCSTVLTGRIECHALCATLVTSSNQRRRVGHETDLQRA